MVETLERRAGRSESGLTVVEALALLVIVGLLLAIAIPSYLSLRDRASKTAAQVDLRALVPAVESFGHDNGGAAADVDGNAATSGYQGMTLAFLEHAYDHSLEASGRPAYAVPPQGFRNTRSDYCITATVGGWTAFKHGPTASISVERAAAFTPSSCT